MKKLDSFKLLFKYLNKDKFKMIIYILLVLSTYVPVLSAAYFWGKGLENLLSNNFIWFVIYVGIWTFIYILCFTIFQIFRDKLYNYLEIKFTKNVSIDLYNKIDKLPAIAFEDIGVGEFINRLHNDTDRIMSLLSQLIKLACKSLAIIAVLILSFKISWILGVEILTFGLVMGFISTYFFPKIKKTQENIKTESDEYVKKATENITGIREIKALGIKDIIECDIKNVLDNLFKHEKDIRSYEVIYYALNNLIYFLLNFMIYFTAGKFLLEGNITYALFTMLDSYIWRIDEVVESISDFGV